MEDNKYGIILDGKMDETVWNTVPEYTGFKKLTTQGGGDAPVQTVFKVLPCEDRIYVGVKCLEPEGMEDILATRYLRNSYTGHALELFFSPSGNSYEFYQFVVTINGDTMTQYYSEGGNIRPDFYRPDWNQAVYIGDDHWSIEVEIPLSAFYWTTQDRWNTKWLLNIARNRVKDGRTHYSTWSDLQFRFLEPANFRSLEGMPMRPACNEVRIISALVDLREETAEGYRGVMEVKADIAQTGIYVFTSDHADTVELLLETGNHVFTTSCFYEKEGRTKTMLCLTRKDDGVEFKRYYPVLAKFEPIKLKMVKPEYRNNFYPGQDHSEVTGTVTAVKPVTLKLEGPGIETTEISPNADGTFTFATPNFQEGEAWLTATIDGYEIKKKIRRLADTGHAMVWISQGNLVVNGKPTLRRNMYGCFYRIGEAFKRRYLADDLHETLLFRDPMVQMQPSVLLRGSEGAGGEATKDQMPSAEMFRKIDEVIEANKDRDFAYYYLSDEPECRGLSSVYLKHMYAYIADKDPYHVILSASRSADSMVDMADWFETHPYICPYNNPEEGTRVYLRPINSLGNFVDHIVKLNRPDKCIGFLPTCYGSGGGANGWDYINFEEYVCHTWAGMIHGGKSLWPYASHDLNDRPALYEGTRYIFSSFEALEELVLHGKRTTLLRSDDAECVLYDNGDEKMFVLVNFTQQPKTVTVDGITGTWHSFRHGEQITGNTFSMNPLEVVIGTNVVKDAGLPTYAETVALIDKLEYERTHRGSLLFNRHPEIAIFSSGFKSMCKHKLFDGVTDNLAGWVQKADNNYMEVDLTKVKPTFRKLVIGGCGIEDMALKFKNGDMLTDAAPAEVKTEEFAKTYFFAEPVCPDVLRMEFQGKSVELYEIEAF